MRKGNMGELFDRGLHLKRKTACRGKLRRPCTDDMNAEDLAVIFFSYDLYRSLLLRKYLAEGIHKEGGYSGYNLVALLLCFFGAQTDAGHLRSSIKDAGEASFAEAASSA